MRDIIIIWCFGQTLSVRRYTVRKHNKHCTSRRFPACPFWENRKKSLWTFSHRDAFSTARAWFTVHRRLTTCWHYIVFTTVYAHCCLRIIRHTRGVFGSRRVCIVSTTVFRCPYGFGQRPIHYDFGKARVLRVDLIQFVNTAVLRQTHLGSYVPVLSQY